MKIKLLIAAIFLALLAGGAGGAYLAVSRGLPSIADLKKYSPAAGTKIYADDDTLIGELKVEKGIFVPLDEIPRSMSDAVVAVEDARFWKHGGIDYLAVVRALLKDAFYRSFKEGGSTLTQQLAKVVFLSPEKTLKRKLMEAALAVKIERSLSKKEILELYLNKVYFGHGAYGVEMAARTYFGKPARELTLAEAALIAGLVKAPTRYSPYNNLSRAKARQKIVLRRMEEEGYITEAEERSAYRTPLYLSSPQNGPDIYNYFIEYVRKYLEETYGVDAVYREGLKVYTTLDKRMQAEAVSALRAGLSEVDKREGWRGPIGHRSGINFGEELKGGKTTMSVVSRAGDTYDGLVLKVAPKEALIETRGVIGKLALRDAEWARKILEKKSGKTTKLPGRFSLTALLKPGDTVKVRIKSVRGSSIRLALEQDPEVEGALVAVEPHTGFIRAMVGGYDFRKSAYNRVLLAKRQPGSAFKPVIYAAAMDHGFTPASIIEDEPVTYKGGPDGQWRPENYDHEFHGPTRLREALALSLNVVTVKLVDSIGIDTVRNFAKTMGFTGKMPRNLSIALGSFDISPFEMAMLYNVFASGGQEVKPVSIKYITNGRRKILESNEPRLKQVISPQTAFLATSMMEDVVKHGTGWRAKALGVPVAGKTGTTNDYRDAWFIGYTTNLVACVWVGYDDPRTLGPMETGARAASPIWVSFMNRAARKGAEEFKEPKGIVSCFIDPKTGLRSHYDTDLREYFKDGTEPKDFARRRTIWEIKDPSKFNFD